MHQKINLLSFIIFILNYKNFIIIFYKILLRIFDNKSKISKEDNLIFIKKNLTTINEFCNNINKNLWIEAMDFKRKLDIDSKKILKNIEIDLGGGGAYDLVYFFTRIIKPKYVLETGVAAGYSSLSFLEAMEKNSEGILFSSDFPYFRIKNPEKYIGILVQKKYHNWNLYIKGDRFNINEILNRLAKNKIDIIHYDSDKTYNGRKYFFNKVQSFIDSKTLIIMDDIQDNSFFYEYIISKKPNKWKIFEFKKKYVGVILPNFFKV